MYIVKCPTSPKMPRSSVMDNGFFFNFHNTAMFLGSETSRCIYQGEWYTDPSNLSVMFRAHGNGCTSRIVFELSLR